MTKINWDDYPEKLHPFVAHGCEFSQRSKSNWVGTAPFSSRENKFNVNPQTGQWDDKVDGISGNVYTFLMYMQEVYMEGMTDAAMKRLEGLRGVPVEVFESWDLGYDAAKKTYYMPVYSPKGDTLRDIRRWSLGSRRWMSTKGLSTYIGNAYELASCGKDTRVWVCEGEWDCMVLDWWLGKVGYDEDVCVFLPGASTFKKEWVKFFKGKDVIFCYDNDDSGDKGAERARKLFHDQNGVGRQYICWPDDWKPGYDINDFVAYNLENEIGLDTGYTYLTKRLLSKVERRDKGQDAYTDMNEEDLEEHLLTREEAPSFQEVIETAERFYSVDDEYKMGMLSCLVVAWSIKVERKDPLWLFIVSPPGGGKSAMLSAFSDSMHTVFRSTLTSKQLVSGFKTEEDPSLLPKLNNKCLINKDWTTTMAQAIVEQQTLNGILRESYDGSYEQSYGNAVLRKYQNVYFSMLCGVTPAIHSHSDAMMGERFLKFNMQPQSMESKMKMLMAADGQAGRSEEVHEAMNEVVGKFLNVKYEPEKMVEPPLWFKEMFAGLSQVISALRATVDRDKYEKTINFRPELEVGTRPYKQLMKLARVAHYRLQLKTYNEEFMIKWLRKLALDSCTGFNVEVVEEMMRQKNRGLTVKEMSENLRLNAATINKQLKDLGELHLVSMHKGESEGRRGRPSNVYVVEPELARMWGIAGLGGDLSLCPRPSLKPRVKMRRKKRTSLRSLKR